MNRRGFFGRVVGAIVAGLAAPRVHDVLNNPAFGVPWTPPVPDNTSHWLIQWGKCPEGVTLLAQQDKLLDWREGA